MQIIRKRVPRKRCGPQPGLQALIAHSCNYKKTVIFLNNLYA